MVYHCSVFGYHFTHRIVNGNETLYVGYYTDPRSGKRADRQAPLKDAKYGWHPYLD